MRSPVNIVMRKELKDALRDKRSVMAAMSYAFFGPLLMAVAFYVLISQLTDTSNVKIDIEGAEYAPAFVAHLERQGIVTRDEDWPAGQQPITLAIAPEWEDNIATGQPAKVTLTADFSSQKQRTDIRRVESAVENYTRQLSYIRLQMRGIDPRITQGVDLVKHDTATKGSKAAILLGSVLIFILLSVFFSGMNVAIDISAGERERNSLELLLSQPLTTEQLVWGKALAASAFAMFGGILSAVLIPFIFKFLPLHKIGISIVLAWPMILLIMLLLVPLALLATALQLFVSFRAKSFKEAQTYISLLLMAPMLVVFGVEFARVKNQILYYLPLTGQHQALLDIIKGESLQWGAMAVSAVATVLVSMLLLRLISRMLSSEKVVFGL